MSISHLLLLLFNAFWLLYRISGISIDVVLIGLSATRRMPKRPNYSLFLSFFPFCFICFHYCFICVGALAVFLYIDVVRSEWRTLSPLFSLLFIFYVVLAAPCCIIGTSNSSGDAYALLLCRGAEFSDGPENAVRVLRKKNERIIHEKNESYFNWSSNVGVWGRWGVANRIKHSERDKGDERNNVFAYICARSFFILFSLVMKNEIKRIKLSVK